jgi:hypothetical protein
MRALLLLQGTVRRCLANALPFNAYRRWPVDAEAALNGKSARRYLPRSGEMPRPSVAAHRPPDSRDHRLFVVISARARSRLARRYRGAGSRFWPFRTAPRRAHLIVAGITKRRLAPRQPSPRLSPNVGSPPRPSRRPSPRSPRSETARCPRTVRKVEQPDRLAGSATKPGKWTRWRDVEPQRLRPRIASPLGPLAQNHELPFLGRAAQGTHQAAAGS